MNKKKNIKIVAIKGSVRPKNMTAKALNLVIDELKNFDGVSLEMIDPAELELALPGKGGESAAESIRSSVKQATGVIFATPEYHGSYSSVTKLVIDNLGFPSSLEGKPVALLGVAAGAIGAIKAMEHLASVLTHVGAFVIPGHVSVARVNDVFDEDGNCTDEKMEKRIRSVAHNLMDYIHRNICPRVAMEEVVRGNV